MLTLIGLKNEVKYRICYSIFIKKIQNKKKELFLMLKQFKFLTN